MKKRKQKLVEKIYGWIGPYYNLVYGKLPFDEGRRVAIELIAPKKGEKILEVGVGTGLALPLYPRDSQVTGVDLAESMLKEARLLIKRENLKNCQVKKMDATALEFADNSFDKVLGNLFISATSFPKESLEEMKRVCKPGGTIVLMNHFKSENPLLGRIESALNPLAQGFGFKSDLEMRPLLASVGLKPKEVRRVNFMGMWTAVSMVNKK